MTDYQIEEKQMPVLALRDVVVFPHMVMPLFVGRKKSIVALEEAKKNNHQILLVGQKDEEQEDPTVADFFEIGVRANIIQHLEMPDGSIKLLVEGLERVKLVNLEDDGTMFKACTEAIVEDENYHPQELQVLTELTLKEFESYAKHNKKVPSEVASILTTIKDYSRLADTIATHLTIDHKRKR